MSLLYTEGLAKKEDTIRQVLVSVNEEQCIEFFTPPNENPQLITVSSHAWPPTTEEDLLRQDLLAWDAAAGEVQQLVDTFEAGGKYSDFEELKGLASKAIQALDDRSRQDIDIEGWAGRLADDVADATD